MKILKILILEESDLNQTKGLSSLCRFKSNVIWKMYEADFIIDKTYNPPQITKYSSTEAQKEGISISLEKI